jgi:hypothetical protein
MDELAREPSDLMKRFQAWRVQDIYRNSKSAATKKYINKKESPSCPIDEENICQHFREAWDHRRGSFMRRRNTHRLI